MEITNISLIDGVFEITEKFMEEPTYVWLNPETIKHTALKIKEKIKDKSEHWLGYPKWLNDHENTWSYFHIDMKNYFLLLYELIAGSINYQYWYGRYNIRPNNSGSTLMYKLLDESFHEVGNKLINPLENSRQASEIFIKKLLLYRFPNMENRIRHIREIFNTNSPISVPREEWKLDKFIEGVVTAFPGYGKDMFLKRVFLLCMMLHRRIKWFKDEIRKVPIPADYQIPRVLRSLHCIEYHSLLSVKVDGHELIPSGSLMECEIRAASVLACAQLAKHSGYSMCDVDTYLWLNRNECKEPFHLTVTTDY